MESLLLFGFAVIALCLAAVGTVVVLGKADFSSVMAWGCISTIVVAALSFIGLVMLSPLLFVGGMVAAFAKLFGVL